MTYAQPYPLPAPVSGLGMLDRLYAAYEQACDTWGRELWWTEAAPVRVERPEAVKGA